MKIYIVGCAKSGTTLLRRLYYAYEGIKVIPYEIELEPFLSIETKKGVLVGKRTFNTIFSHGLSDGELARQKALIRENPDAKYICIYRDGRDAIESGVTYQRWIASILQMIMNPQLLNATIKYETLVTYPDVIQTYLTNLLGLKPIYRFSQYPDFFTATDEAIDLEAKYKPRPIGPEKIGKNPEGYKETAGKNKFMFEMLLKLLGYI